MYPRTDWPDESIHVGPTALGLLLDVARPTDTKLGVHTEPGWGAHIDPANETALLVSAEWDSAAVYPEGGANVTVYASADKPQGEGWAEVENVGPLQDIRPGETLELVQFLEILGPIDLPRPFDPEAARRAIEALRR
jgi:hypothetical protein